MKMNYNLRYCLLILIIFCSCTKHQTILDPPGNLDYNLVGTKPISDTVMRNMEGIYSLSSGSATLGTQFVCKVSKHKVSFFSNNSGIFLILGYGLNPKDGSIKFSGFWRFSEYATQGTVSFSVASSEGAMDLLVNGIAKNMILKGFVQAGSQQSLTLKYQRPFSQYVLTHEFSVFAHHGIQTTSNPPYAQNSLNVVLHAEDYGVNGLELDVRLTKDNVPILMHDASFDTRLTEKGPLYGDFGLYTFDFLENYVRLIDGQKIPSLAQALTAFVDSTTLKYVWMDVKGDPDVFKYMEPVVRDAYARAAAAHRNVVFIADLPTTEVIDEYHNQPSYGADLPCMCELSMQDAIDNNCKYFGPRFTLGLLLDDVNKGHTLGIKSWVWTINDKTTIQHYMQDGKYDGIDTDYPAYVIYNYYANF
jgi:glycerophosphoryl diester phosphodiesterase